MTTQQSNPVRRGEFRSPQPLIAGRPFFVAGIVPLATGLLEVTPPLASWVVGAAIAGIGALRTAWTMRERAKLRRFADDELAAGASPAETPVLTWRASELVSRGNRRILARSLRAVVAEAREPRFPTSSPLNRYGLRPHLGLVAALAQRVGRLEEPVDPRGMVLVERLIRDGFGPLYVRSKEPQLQAALERCLSALEPLREHEAASRTRFATSRTRFAASRSRRAAEAPAGARAVVVVRHRGRR